MGEIGATWVLSAGFLQAGGKHASMVLMKDVITMDEAGRLLVPHSVREALHLRLPAEFALNVVGPKLELTLISSGSVASPEISATPVGSGEARLAQMWEMLGPAPEIEYDKL
jgi:hypothetical protein